MDFLTTTARRQQKCTENQNYSGSMATKDVELVSHQDSAGVADTNGAGDNVNIDPEQGLAIADALVPIDDTDGLQMSLEQSKEKVHKPSFMIRFLELLGFNSKSLEDLEAENHAPQLPYWKIFKIFFWFGCRAFGG